MKLPVCGVGRGDSAHEPPASQALAFGYSWQGAPGSVFRPGVGAPWRRARVQIPVEHHEMKKGASEFTELPWHFMVPKAGFEPARVSPPPPQAALPL